MDLKKVDGQTLLTIEGLIVSPEYPVCVDLIRAAEEMRLPLTMIPDFSGIDEGEGEGEQRRS
jgi:hypothetical protein